MRRFPVERDEFQYFHLVDGASGVSNAAAEADFLAFIVSQPDVFHFCYGYLEVVAEERVARGHAPIRVPSLIEFIELLEFRERELLRTDGASGDDLYWRWPAAWPNTPSWNGHVVHSMPRAVSETVSPAQHRQYMLATTRTGIHLNKILGGHGRPVLVDYVSALHLSRLRDLLVPPAGRRAHIVEPQIWRSLDLPARNAGASQETAALWPVCGLLGDYRKGNIRIHERAIQRCAADTGIDPQSLYRVVLLHEAAHHYLPRCLDSDLSEALAQLLVHLSLRHGSTPNRMLDAFQTLLQHQPRRYRMHEDLLNVCDDSDQFTAAIHALGNRTATISFNDFRNSLP